jgi:Polyketide cyclase / dehydrase and lipid transport
MTVHIVVSHEMPATAEATFDLIHDYDRRLEWDTLLRRARTEGDLAPAKGVVAVCTARRLLGGYSFSTRYVAFDRPKVAAIKLESKPPFFAAWGASIRHEPLPGGRSSATYTMTFRCRPSRLAWAIEPAAKLMFRYETRRRLAALASALADTPVRS